MPSAAKLGRSFEPCKSPLLSEPVKMLKGRPEGVRGSRDSKVRKEPLRRARRAAPFSRELSAPLKTIDDAGQTANRARLSARTSRLSCGLRSVCRSDESSIECDHVYEARNWKLFEKRRFNSRFIAL